MSNKVIIDGVDVSECSLYRNRKCIKRKYGVKDKIGFIQEIYEECNSFCDYGAYARAEQLQRLKAENEELKEHNKTLVYNCEKFREGNIKLKQALEEIREIAQYHIDNCCMLESCYYKEECGANCYPKKSGKVEYCCYENIGQILNKINEVQNE